MGRSTVVAVLVGVTSALVVSGLLLIRKEHQDGRAKAARLARPDASSSGLLEESDVAVHASQAARSNQIRLVDEDSALANPRLNMDNQVDPTSGYLDERIEIYLESFLSSEPDILGWTALFGELARSAELDASATETNDQGETHGVFRVPGTTTPVKFKVTADGCSVIMRGESSPAGIDHVGYRAEMGYRTRHGQIQSAYGAVQFLARDAYEEHALDKRTVGYTFEFADGQTLLRPMEARLNEGRYELRVSNINEELGYGSLQPVYEWHAVLSGIDTPEEVSQRADVSKRD